MNIIAVPTRKGGILSNTDALVELLEIEKELMDITVDGHTYEGRDAGSAGPQTFVTAWPMTVACTSVRSCSGENALSHAGTLTGTGRRWS